MCGGESSKVSQHLGFVEGIVFISSGDFFYDEHLKKEDLRYVTFVYLLFYFFRSCSAGSSGVNSKWSRRVYSRLPGLVLFLIRSCRLIE